MKFLIFLEEITKLIFCFLASLHLGFSPWFFLILLFTPDISMLGYLFSNKTGAWLYNLFHHQTTALLIGLAGVSMGNSGLELAALILFGHSVLDRALGFGLKYEKSFRQTHLGQIGKKEELSKTN
jgi:hypothetical protein